MTLALGPPGWHGKLPSLGDFASRRLDAEFVEPWDGWLAAGLHALREAQPEAWLAAYLASPSWRFLLMPGVLPGAASGQGWAGVLMPSVDRVGRYFPLTLARPLGDGPASAPQMASLWQWLGRLDELARDALYEDWSAERLEEELARMARPGIGGPAGPAAGPSLDVPDGAGGIAEVAADARLDVSALIDGAAQRAWAEQARGRAFWFARPDEGPARLLVSRGLPAAVSMSRLLGVAATI